MVQDDFIKLPRIYVEGDLHEGAVLSPREGQAHYLCHVLRLRAGDGVRLFNGRDGEWQGEIGMPAKKQVAIRLVKKLKDQPPPPRPVHLFFAPIKKARMDWLIEKAVELGTTHFHPVLTQNTEVRAINEERVRAQIIESAEQCERMTLPALLPLRPFLQSLGDTPTLACLERMNLKPLNESIPENGGVAFLIGPEGGFTAEEKEKLRTMSNITAVSLGPQVLRSETAALKALCAVNP